MTRLMIVVAAVCAVLSGQALAQQGGQPQTLDQLNQKMEANLKKVRPGWSQTMMVPSNQSLTDLLNSGWDISGGSFATGLVLRQGDKWMACEMDDGRMFGSPPASHYLSLN